MHLHRGQGDLLGDNGHGIAAKHLPRICRVLRRGGRSTRSVLLN
jgi:hypothetical protein